MADKSQAMSNLAYVNEVVQALPPSCKKKFFDHYVKYSKAKNQTKSIRPSTPKSITSSKAFQKWPLNSYETPKRNKKNSKVL
jgi:hypothetical protein